MNLSPISILTLRYVIAVQQTGSINKAAQQMFISRSSISKAIKTLETEIGVTLFCRSSKGVIATHEGEDFINEAKKIVFSLDSFEGRYYINEKITNDTLLIGSMRATAIVNCFIEYYLEEGQKHNLQNYAILYETCENVMQIIRNHICGVGIVFYTSNHEEAFMKSVDSYGLEAELLERSPISIQVRRGHPLEGKDIVTVDMLQPYAQVVYGDGGVTDINYCSDITQYNSNIHCKRIIVYDNGAMRQIVNNTDAYYIGCDHGRFNFFSETNPIYLHLKDVDYTMNCVWIKRKEQILTKPEQDFVDRLKTYFK